MIDPLTISAIVGGVAQIGQSIHGMVQGRKQAREAAKIKKPNFELQREFEQNRALALNRYNAANPFIAQATNNLNAQTASATMAAQQTAGDSAAALQALTGITSSAHKQNANIMAQADQMKDQKYKYLASANMELAGEKNRLTDQQYQDYLIAQGKAQVGQQNMMNAVGGVSNFAGDIFSIAAENPDAFEGWNKKKKKNFNVNDIFDVINSSPTGMPV